jgi:hypothetical protein
MDKEPKQGTSSSSSSCPNIAMSHANEFASSGGGAADADESDGRKMRVVSVMLV